MYLWTSIMFCRHLYMYKMIFNTETMFEQYPFTGYRSLKRVTFFPESPEALGMITINNIVFIIIIIIVIIIYTNTKNEFLIKNCICKLQETKKISPTRYVFVRYFWHFFTIHRTHRISGVHVIFIMLSIQYNSISTKCLRNKTFYSQVLEIPFKPRNVRSNDPWFRSSAYTQRNHTSLAFIRTGNEYI